MHNKNNRRINIPIANTALLALLLFSQNATADNANADNESYPMLGGNLSVNYTTNIHDKNDHRSIRNLHWNGLLSLNTTERYSIYIALGGYRVYEDETGDFWTDTVFGFADNDLRNIGDNGKLKYNIQLTIPTSELSKKDDLNTAVRAALIYSDSIGIFDYTISPRLRKNFHQYKTAGGKSLTEWISSVNLGLNYNWSDFTISASFLGGTSWSYQHSRQDWTYSGALSGKWYITDDFYTSLSASNSGVYYDAERGTIGNIDLFDENNAVYSIAFGYTF